MFDRHWWLKRDISEAELQRTRILEPKVKPRKKRQSKTGLRIPSGFEFTDLNHVASRRPREFPDPPPPLLPSRNPTPSVPASQPLVQDRTQRHLEVSQQQTAHISSHIHPLEPRLTQSTSFQHQTVPVQQLLARQYPAIAPWNPLSTPPNQVAYHSNRPSFFTGSQPQAFAARHAG
jgi:hypothetical protein